ncbi:MAG: proline iminopeptidase-family hydrolase [Solirubrobacteraceae bacterium]
MEGHFERDGHRTWYRVVGDLEGAGGVPVIVCHGGPGATHDYLENVAGLLAGERAVVLYDQLGNGRSDHLPDADPGFWTPALFQAELAGLAAHLGIADRYHVLGQSWGGMLGLLHALEHPPGLVSLVAANSPASVADFVAGCNELLDAMPADLVATIREDERTGRTDTPEFNAAVEPFYKQHVCRVDPWPDHVVRSFTAMEEDPTVYGTMNGPTEFTVVGTIRDFDLTDRFGELDLPVLLVSGGHDEVRPWVVRGMHERLPRSEWTLFEDASHMPHVEEPERFGDVVGAFLARAEGSDPLTA